MNHEVLSAVASVHCNECRKLDADNVPDNSVRQRAHVGMHVIAQERLKDNSRGEEGPSVSEWW